MTIEQLEYCTAETNVVASLADRPNDQSGLTAAQVKAKFDAADAAIKAYINDTLVPYVNETLAMAINNAADSVADGSVTTAKLGDAAVTTEKLAGDLLVPIANGGTGQTTAQGIRNALGLGNTTDALPIANGGTGQTTAQGIRNALGLGNTTDALPIANGGTGANNKATALSNLGGISIKRLWQNASPTSAFYPQNLALDFSGCTHVLVLAYADTSHAYTVDVIGVPGVYAMATVAWGNTSTNSHRLFSFGSTSIWIDTGYSGSTTNNGTVVPYQIYGIKGVT